MHRDLESNQLAHDSVDLWGLDHHATRHWHHFWLSDGHHHQCSTLGFVCVVHVIDQMKQIYSFVSWGACAPVILFKPWTNAPNFCVIVSVRCLSPAFRAFQTDPLPPRHCLSGNNGRPKRRQHQQSGFSLRHALLWSQAYGASGICCHVWCATPSPRRQRD